MKKRLLFVLSLAMLFSLCACGGSSDAPTKDNTASATLALGETASTDLIDFILDDSVFTLYASGTSNAYMEPTDDSNTRYAASLGHFLCFYDIHDDK